MSISLKNIATGGQNKSCAAFVLTSGSNFAANASPKDFIGFAVVPSLPAENVRKEMQAEIYAQFV